MHDYDILPNWYEDLIGTSRTNPDTDGDFITDGDEITVTGTSPLLADTDGNGWTDYEDWSGNSQATADPDNDGANNLAEYNAATDPRVPDTDADGLGDGLEIGTGGAFSPTIADTDANGVSDYDQYYGITPPPSPQPADADNDGLADDQEAAHGASASDADSDDDSLLDGAEVAWGSSPADADSDDDGAGDAIEASLGLSPNDPDTDDDGLADGFEIAHNGGATYLPNDADSNDDGVSDYQDYTGQTLPPPPSDTDGDGLLDAQEAAHGCSASDPDSDDDGLLDGLEVSWGSNPTLVDSDGDSVTDGTEYAHHLQPMAADSDGDSLSDGYELFVSGTSPSEPDTDQEGLRDDYELLIGVPPTNPNNPDSDGDFITDFEEVNAADAFPGFNQPLNPTLLDSDGDQISDYIEVSNFLLDSDGGGIPDRMERFYGLNAHHAADDVGDLDGDGFTNLQEYQAGHSLNSDFSAAYDWDVDGMSNVWEIAHGLNPHDHHDAAEDPDGDWRPNLIEFQDGYDPNVADSGNSGTSPDGQPLAAQGDGSEWDADWDGDGSSNLDELLNDGTDPTDPDPEPCGCGGGACACTESGQCSATCEPPPCDCGGELCSCSQDGSCSGPCNGTSACTCGGYTCGCPSSGSCSGASDCGGAGPCTCTGNHCSCTESGQCSSPCMATDPCTCSAMGCPCADASGCTSGSCYIPPPCTCDWIFDGCTCANANQCSGDCYGPCQCPHAGGSCLCTSFLECDGSGDMCDYLPCDCSVAQGGGNCPCQTGFDCADDCDPLKAEIDGPTAVFVNKAVTYTTQPSGGTAPYTYQWQFANGQPDTATTSSAEVSWTETGTYSVDLTVKDANDATVSKTITVNVYEIISSTVKDPEPRDRKRIGVGEKVDIMVVDAGGIPYTDVAWQIMNAAGAALTPNLTGTQLDAADQTGGIDVEATIGNASGTITFTSIEPTGLTGRRIYHRTAKTPEFSEAYMEIELTLEPTDVSFEALKVKEFDGWSPPDRPHTPSEAEAHVLGGNILEGYDRVFTRAHGVEDDFFSWNCDWKWRLATFDSSWVPIQGSPFVQAVYKIGENDTGTTHCRVEKFGLEVDNGWTQ